ncbi:MAG: type II toxin-antitoxin system ParD family antitoxin [Thermomicrobiales bacterium]
MNVSLTPHLEAMVRQKVASGRYNNASEVVREALRLMEEHDQHQRLRAALAIGREQVERGEGRPYAAGLRDEIQQAARRKAQEGKTPNADVVP